MLVYAVRSDEAPERAVKLFVRREDAEAFVDDVRDDDEELAATLRLEPVEARRLLGRLGETIGETP